MRRRSRQARLGFVFIPGFADWEYGTLAASAVEWFGAEAVVADARSPAGQGISGFLLTPQRGAGAAENDDLDAVAIIGSDGWAEPYPPDVEPLVRAVAERGGLVGGICAGTLPLAKGRAVLDGRDHTSNGRDWILGHVPGLCAAPTAIATCRTPSPTGASSPHRARRRAPSPSPSCRHSIPSGREQFAEMTAMLAREHAAAN